MRLKQIAKQMRSRFTMAASERTSDKAVCGRDRMFTAEKGRRMLSKEATSVRNTRGEYVNLQ